MIRYTLKCSENHSFESWFQSADAYDALAAGGHLACAVCGSDQISKGMMAPPVSSKATVKPAAEPALTAPASDVEKAVEAVRRKVEQTADYVGDSFASEARAMHLGEVPKRSIYGEARLDQARDLIEDGVPLMPLPFRAKQKLT